ncbi:hypothetical protein VVMO6_03529 [Vibrio vulnificus MO6-24/O]|nr:hypothetical protein VVMO6_03529 [Vibrio vulnificus MO6-24/O]
MNFMNCHCQQMREECGILLAMIAQNRADSMAAQGANK